MKKTLSILLVLALAGFGLFAAVTTDGPAKIKMNSIVDEFIAIGVSSARLAYDDFVSLDTYLDKANSTIDTDINMLDLSSNTSVGFVSGVNNSKKTISIYLSTTALTSGSDKVGLTMVTNYTTIPGSKESKFAFLQGTEIFVKENTPGAAARALAGTYTGTITIKLDSN
jgi:hypothetical protein